MVRSRDERVSRGIWAAEASRIVTAMERATGLRFEPGPIRAVIYEGPSFSGFGERPMQLRASYLPATKRATLVHELGHRLMGELVPADVDHHSIIFLFVYDVWVELWGQPFADEQVTMERARTENSPTTTSCGRMPWHFRRPSGPSGSNGSCRSIASRTCTGLTTVAPTRALARWVNRNLVSAMSAGDRDVMPQGRACSWNKASARTGVPEGG